VQLTASGEFEEALALCKLLPPEDSNLRAAKESSIHIRSVQIVQYKGLNNTYFESVYMKRLSLFTYLFVIT
jgi:hypothetical protein